MRIVAALCWYDEPAATLQRVIASVAPLVSCVVAMDGAWQGFPHNDPLSSPRQAKALRDACEANSLDLVDVSIGATLPSQAFKRSFLYREASERADWVLVIDADEQLVVENVMRLRRQLSRLARRRLDAMNVLVSTPGPAPGRRRRAGGGLTATAPTGDRWQPRLLRADTSIMVGPHSHRTLSTNDVLIQRGNLEDADLHLGKRSARIERVQGVAIVNNTHSRSTRRIAAKRAYGKARHIRGVD